MRLFLLVFFLTYGSMHAYSFIKAKNGLGFGMKGGIPLALFMLVMIFAPIIVRLSEKAGLEITARSLSYIGYTWLGILFVFVSFAGAIDVYRATVYGAGLLFQKNLSSLTLSAELSFFIPLIISLAVSIFGYFEAWKITTEKVVLTTSKLPANINKLKIVQISDVHLGLIVREKRLQKIVDEVMKAEPDILVSTGDLVDGQIDNLNGLADLLQKIQPRYGKYAITGNHEFYAGLGQALNFTTMAGFRILRNEAINLDGMITIAGVDDESGQYFDKQTSVTERDLLSGVPDGTFMLFLKHRPIIDQDSIGLFDLQLSGHTHKGQIFPFSIVTWLYYPVHAGCLTAVDGCHLYVSRGSGTWGPPVRFLSPPEVTLIELVKE